MSDQFNSGWGSAQIPYSEEAEEATLGAIMLNPVAFFAIASFIRADDFYILRHKFIWEAFERINERGDPIDYLTVMKELKNAGYLTEVGGPAFLTHLLDSTPTSVHAEVYAHLVERMATRRT